MYRNRTKVTDIIAKALKIRQKFDYEPWQAICVFDLAEKMGVKIYFDAIGSMEGLYFNSKVPRIILSSLRPPGRKAYNCAHELAHHILGHGTQVDELINNSTRKQTSEEFFANCFAGFLLMPKTAINYGFSRRQWSPLTCTKEQLFTIAGWLGVGYITLIKHMQYSLKIFSFDKAEKLCKFSPKEIRATILGYETKENLLVVDEEWKNKPIDIQIGDYIKFNHDIQLDGNCVKTVDGKESNRLYKASRPGIGRFYTFDGNWAEFVRVSRKEYSGHSQYRHLEEPEDE